MRPLVALLALALTAPALAVPMQLTHQGRLSDSAGVALEGAHQLTVSIFADASGGSPLWTESLNAELEAGAFSVVLGVGVPLDSDVLDGSVRYVELAVDGGAPLPQRLPLTSVPYAVRAGQAAVADALAEPLDWSELTNVPEDADSFADLACSAGDVPTFDGASWGCASPTPAVVDVTTLTGTIDIDNLPVGTGTGTVAAGDHTHSFGQITGELGLDRTNGDLPLDRTTGDLPMTRVSGDLPIDRTTGNFPFARLPVGTTSTSVARGDHTHTAAQVGAIPVGGSVPVADTSAACGTPTLGHLKFDGTDLRFCDGSDWLVVQLRGRFNGDSQSNAAPTCDTLRQSHPGTPSGVYWVDPNGGNTSDAYEAYCDMTTDGGGWTYDTHDGLVAYWSFDDTSGFANADFGSFSGGVTGSASNNGPAPRSGLGRSMRFDNTDGQYITLSPQLPFTAASTLMFWVRTTICQNNQIPFSFGDNTNWLHDNIRAGTISYNGTRFQSESGANNCTSRIDTWYHMAYVDTGSTYLVYQNGSPVAATSLSYATLDPMTIAYFGSRPGFGTNGLGGELDDVAMFNRALSQSEIQRVYNNAAAGRAFRWK
jgi:hypothetical protein